MWSEDQIKMMNDKARKAAHKNRKEVGPLFKTVKTVAGSIVLPLKWWRSIGEKRREEIRKNTVESGGAYDC